MFVSRTDELNVLNRMYDKKPIKWRLYMVVAV
jgi:hypothetical protein